MPRAADRPDHLHPRLLDVYAERPPTETRAFADAPDVLAVRIPELMRATGRLGHDGIGDLPAATSAAQAGVLCDPGQEVERSGTAGVTGGNGNFREMPCSSFSSPSMGEG